MPGEIHKEQSVQLTILSFAVLFGNVRLVRLLLSNQQIDNSLLMLALVNNQDAVVSELLANTRINTNIDEKVVKPGSPYAKLLTVKKELMEYLVKHSYGTRDMWRNIFAYVSVNFSHNLI